jgi:D-alanyl-D-alanine carboxypeptidase
MGSSSDRGSGALPAAAFKSRPSRESLTPSRIQTTACFTSISAYHAELGVPADYAEIRGIPLQPEAAENQLTQLNESGLRCIRLLKPAADAWQRMQRTAKTDGITLLPISGYRSVSRQVEIIRAKLQAGQTIETVLRVNAAPGYSEHHTGRAIDIGTPGSVLLEEGFADTPAFAWLSINAPQFGFTLSYRCNNPLGIAYEPWHWYWSVLVG